ncbi:30S ribosomal protein S3 [Candidatus Micrarchaeota archaeon RBG_16_36_9]|nr:MAG: 30S ribosomal protein S3 [Candidatus Micrarchaeota archaeon RBG_16_36_9]
MALERRFVKESIRNLDVEEFLSNEFSRAGYSHCDIQRTPLSIRITVFAHKPGIIIGRGGKNIDSIIQILKDKFGFENPQLDVQEVSIPDLDPFIISKWIASAIERGLNYKRVVNLALERVIGAGAVGVAIRIAGKIGGDISRVEKFSSGYMIYSGDPVETDVMKAYAQANVKLGIIGIQVRILTIPPKELELMKNLEENKVVTEEKVVEEVKPEPIKEEEPSGDNKEEAN